MQLNSMEKVLLIDLSYFLKDQVIAGFKLQLQNEQNNYISALFDKNDLKLIDSEDDSVKKLSLYHIKKKKVIHSTPKTVGVFDFIEKNYPEQKMEAMLDASIDFKTNLQKGI